MSESGPQHLCRQGSRCKDRLRADDGRWYAADVDRPDRLCTHCETAAFKAIAELWADYQALEVAIHEPRGRIDGEKVRKTADRKIPIPLDVDTLMAAIDDETLRWALRITRGDPLPPHARDRVRSCVAILRARTGTLVDLPPQRVAMWMPHPEGGDYDGLAVFDGVDAVLRLAGLHDRARTILGLTERKVERLRDDYCHVCGLASLSMEIETGIIKCRECRNCWSQDEFARLNNPLMAVA